MLLIPHIIFMIIYICCPITLICYILKSAIGKQKDPGFMLKYKSVMMRYRPECYWFVALLITKKMVLAAETRILSTFPIMQVAISIIIQVLFIVALLYWEPWYHSQLNCLHIFVSIIQFIISILLV